MHRRHSSLFVYRTPLLVLLLLKVFSNFFFHFEDTEQTFHLERHSNGHSEAGELHQASLGFTSERL